MPLVLGGKLPDYETTTVTKKKRKMGRTAEPFDFVFG